MSLVIVDVVKNNLLRLAEDQNYEDIETDGFLIGFKDVDNKTFCLSIVKNLNYSLFDVIGFYNKQKNLSKNEQVEKVKAKNLTGTFFSNYFDTDGNLNFFIFNFKDESVNDCKFELITSENYLSSCINISLSGDIYFKTLNESDKNKAKENLDLEIENLEKDFKKLGMNLNNSNFNLKLNTTDKNDLSNLYNHLNEDELTDLESMPGNKAMKEKMKVKIIKKWISDNKKLDFKFCFNKPADSNCCPVNFIFMINHHTPIKVFVQMIEKFFEKMLTLARDEYLNLNDTIDKKANIDFYNFFPKEYAVTYFTIPYPSHLSDDDLTEKRKSYCLQLNLPLTEPLIRKFNATRTRNYYGTTLMNVHSTLLNSSKNTISAVKGNYRYLHYKSLGFDDQGFGCAYRSLQTIISWFDYQGYIDINEVLSIPDIQKKLVEIGDKKPSFQNSKEWIGSQEVGFILKTVYDIDFKVMFVSSGSELATKGRELSLHFAKQGTPIMIGGGSYAYTILGVDFNEKTGSIKFLVLDPHFVGKDELPIILKKGWCEWKEPKFWQANTFYNLCMPQKPIKF